MAAPTDKPTAGHGGPLDNVPIQENAHTQLLQRVAVLEAQIAERRDQNKAQFESLKTMAETSIRTTREMLTAALAASDKAIQKAEVAVDKRFDAGNEIKEAMRNDAQTYARKSEIEVRFQTFDKFMTESRDFMSSQLGKDQGMAATWALIIGAVGLLTGLASLAMIIAKFAK